MDIGTLHGIATITAMVAFLAIVYWAFNPKNRKRFEDDAKLALDEEDSSAQSQKKASSNNLD